MDAIKAEEGKQIKVPLLKWRLDPNLIAICLFVIICLLLSYLFR